VRGVERGGEPDFIDCEDGERGEDIGDACFRGLMGERKEIRASAIARPVERSISNVAPRAREADAFAFPAENTRPRRIASLRRQKISDSALAIGLAAMTAALIIALKDRDGGLAGSAREGIVKLGRSIYYYVRIGERLDEHCRKCAFSNCEKNGSSIQSNSYVRVIKFALDDTCASVREGAKGGRVMTKS